MTYTQSGRIIKMTGGLYTVRLDSGASGSPLSGYTVDCRARGNFRHEHTTPLVGDLVSVQYDDSSYTREGGEIIPSADGTGIMIAEILPRKSSLIRPPLANVDVMLVVIAAASPDPDIPTIDKLLTILEHNRIEPVIIIGKSELKPKRSAKIAALYEKIGYRTFILSCYTGEGVQAFSDFAHTELRGKITAVAGASGAGKSTLLNTVFPNLNLVTGDISEKIGRGKNTTRHTELFDLPGTDGGYIADTAGFSLLDFERFDFFTLEDLPHTLREFTPYLGKCRYTDCTHINDEECAILDAVQAGEIPRTRHEAYKELYVTLKEKKKYK
ncbi:MAG: ribosome small subunit-dependent GTPase A [Clostridia bacterium]|nr:ribosome small subunit-dependent GTPase A [Clostridia bacterium]